MTIKSQKDNGYTEESYGKKCEYWVKNDIPKKQHYFTNPDKCIIDMDMECRRAVMNMCSGTEPYEVHVTCQDGKEKVIKVCIRDLV